MRRRTVSVNDVRRPSVLSRRISLQAASPPSSPQHAPGGGGADNVPEAPQPVLLGLAHELSKAHAPVDDATPRTLGAAARAARCAEILRALAVHEGHD